MDFTYSLPKQCFIPSLRLSFYEIGQLSVTSFSLMDWGNFLSRKVVFRPTVILDAVVHFCEIPSDFPVLLQLQEGVLLSGKVRVKSAVAEELTDFCCL